MGRGRVRAHVGHSCVWVGAACRGESPSVGGRLRPFSRPECFGSPLKCVCLEVSGVAGLAEGHGKGRCGEAQSQPGPRGLRPRRRMSRKGVICPGLVLSAGDRMCRAQDPHWRGSEPRVQGRSSPWAAKGSFPLPRSLWTPSQAPCGGTCMPACPRRATCPRSATPKMDACRWTGAASATSQVPWRAGRGRPALPQPHRSRAPGVAQTCARSAPRAPSRWLYLSAPQRSEPGQVEGPAAVRARLCPQSEPTACTCRVCCGQGPSWGTPVTCWTARCARPTPSAGPGVRVERRPSPPSPHSQRLSGRLCPQPWLHPSFPQL